MRPQTSTRKEPSESGIPYQQQGCAETRTAGHGADGDDDDRIRVGTQERLDTVTVTTARPRASNVKGLINADFFDDRPFNLVVSC